MSQPVRARLTVAVVVAALALISGVIVKAQIGVTPYKVNYNWDKLEGRKIGVASGIRLDPDGQHLWILDRCGANGCAESHARSDHPGRHGREVREELRQGHHEFPARVLHRSRRIHLGHRRRAQRRSARRGRIQEGPRPSDLQVQPRRQAGDDARRSRRPRRR